MPSPARKIGTIQKKTRSKQNTLDLVRPPDSGYADILLDEKDLDPLIYQEIMKRLDEFNRDNRITQQEIVAIKMSIASLDKRISIIEKFTPLEVANNDASEIRIELQRLNHEIRKRKSDTKIPAPNRNSSSDRLKNIEWEKIGKGIGWIIIATSAALMGGKAIFDLFQF